jgi:iron-sulfur cluster assembly protein
VLSLTADAVDAVRAVMALDEGGLRISMVPQSLNGDGPALLVEPVPVPDPDDAVLETDGARVYLEPAAAVALDDKVLHAEREGDALRFSVFEQP